MNLCQGQTLQNLIIDHLLAEQNTINVNGNEHLLNKEIMMGSQLEQFNHLDSK